MKKVIEQDFFLYIGDIEVSTDSDGDIEVLQWNKNREGGCDIVTVGKSKAREVALAICPELGEPTIKTDNTKVILHLESELKEAVELIENARFLIYTATFDDPNICELMKKDIESFSNKSEAFITKHKSKE